MSSERTDNLFFQVLKGVGIALIVTVVYVLFFSVILRLFHFGDKVVFWTDRVMKMLCIFIGTLFSVSGEKGIQKGCLIGALFIMLSSVLFALISGNLFTARVWIELIFGTVIGGLSGIATVNLKR